MPDAKEHPEDIALRICEKTIAASRNPHPSLVRLYNTLLRAQRERQAEEK